MFQPRVLGTLSRLRFRLDPEPFCVGLLAGSAHDHDSLALPHRKHGAPELHIGAQGLLLSRLPDWCQGQAASRLLFGAPRKHLEATINEGPGIGEPWAFLRQNPGMLAQSYEGDLFGVPVSLPSAFGRLPTRLGPVLVSPTRGRGAGMGRFFRYLLSLLLIIDAKGCSQGLPERIQVLAFQAARSSSVPPEIWGSCVEQKEVRGCWSFQRMGATE